MSARQRASRQALDLILPPVLVLWVACVGWIANTHYFVEWHVGARSSDPACSALAQWVRLPSREALSSTSISLTTTSSLSVIQSLCLQHARRHGLPLYSLKMRNCMVQ
jgi:hypothetical protein